MNILLFLGLLTFGGFVTVFVLGSINNPIFIGRSLYLSNIARFKLIAYIFHFKIISNFPSHLVCNWIFSDVNSGKDNIGISPFQNGVYILNIYSAGEWRKFRVIKSKTTFLSLGSIVLHNLEVLSFWKEGKIKDFSIFTSFK